MTCFFKISGRLGGLEKYFVNSWLLIIYKSASYSGSLFFGFLWGGKLLGHSGALSYKKWGTWGIWLTFYNKTPSRAGGLLINLVYAISLIFFKSYSSLGSLFLVNINLK